MISMANMLVYNREWYQMFACPHHSHFGYRRWCLGIREKNRFEGTEWQAKQAGWRVRMTERGQHWVCPEHVNDYPVIKDYEGIGGWV